MNEQVVFDTPWFQLVARTVPGWSGPHYSIRTADYVCVVAAAPGTGLLLVRQFRPAVGRLVLDLPSGHVEPGESPEEAARRELLEETGYAASEVELLGCPQPDVGRLANRMWCFHASGLSRVREGSAEAGVELVPYQKPVAELLHEPEFNHALHFAALLLAIAKGRLALHSVPGQGREA